MGIKIEDYIGKQYNTNEGYLITVVSYDGVRNVTIEFENGYSVNTNMSNVKRGSIKNPYHRNTFGVGFLGIGEYECYKNNKFTNAYKIWRYMLERCYYRTYQDKHPSYKGCTACEEWHNFQNFAKWYEENYYEIKGEKMCLDKDILVKWNKVYSPETCIFVPQSINKLFTKRQNNRGGLPIGVHKHTNGYVAQINIDGNRIHLKKCKTSYEAFGIYKRAKEEYIKNVANRFKNKIPSKLYDAMCNYIVQITD